MESDAFVSNRGTEGGADALRRAADTGVRLPGDERPAIRITSSEQKKHAREGL
jgi:hypothetical protein